jgi:maltooligosyltrehalose synthase
MDAWGDTSISLPAAFAGQRWRNALTGETPVARDGEFRFRIADLLAGFPVALLTAD